MSKTREPEVGREHTVHLQPLEFQENSSRQNTGALHRDCSLHTVVADGSTARAAGRQGLLIASECLTPRDG